MDTIVTLYSYLKSDKKKERFDIILEPLQALTQLSAMAFCPIGTKLTINNNLLYIQIPGWGQGLLRSFNNDKRDDLFYLFNVIIRFNTFYGYLKNNGESDEDAKLFKLLIKLAKQGIDNLLLTYSTIDQPSLLHTLQMYRTLLENPELVMKNNSSNSNSNSNSNSKNDDNNKKDKHKGESSSSSSSSSSSANKNNENTELLNNNNEDVHSKKSINDVFINIRKLYSVNERSILFHLLTLMEKHPDHHQTYLEAINAALMPINNQIKKHQG